MEAEFWTTVINGSANLVIAGAMVIQTILFFATFKFGFKYLDQHEQKITLEIRRKAVHEALRNLIKIDQLLQRMFQSLNIDIDRYEKMKRQSSVLCNDLPVDLKETASEKFISLLVFQDNFKQKEQELTNSTNDLQLNLLLLKSDELIEVYSKLDKSIASLVYVFFKQSKSFHQKTPTPETAEIFIKNTPLNMNDSKNSLVQNYDQIGKNLKERLLSKV